LRRVIACLLFSLLAVGASGCTKEGSAPSGPAGVLRIGLPASPNQLNPILAQNSTDGFVDFLMFSRLVTRDDKGNDIPDLAAAVPSLENGGISKDQRTITYHLRKNAKWQDGVAVTSRDVKYTWQQIMNPRNNVVSKHGYDQIASIDTPDDWTVVVHMKTVFPPMIDTFFADSDSPYEILPEHLLSKYANLNNVGFNAAPVGSGPYKFARWERNDRIVLVANPSYYRGAPKIPRLEIRILPDLNTMEQLLRTHEIDLALETSLDFYHHFANDKNFVRLAVKAPYWNSISFNLRRPPLDDPAVRRAIAFAIDRRRLVENSTYGTGTIAIADQTPFSWAYDPSLRPIPYAPDQAKALLDADGWHTGPGGIRSKNGRPLSLQIIFALGQPGLQTQIEQIQQMLHQVGIDVQIKGYDTELIYAAAGAGGIFNGGKFDMGFYPWIAGSDPDDSSLWTCSNQTPIGYNITHYCSARMDAAQAHALSTFDRNSRKRDYRTIQRLLLQDVPAIFLYDQSFLYVYTPALKNFSPSGISEAWNANEWELTQP
jgi:peptide/nickel transport system substrate-binding protein